MKLSPDEELFLRQWIYDEAHFRNGIGPAKRLQVDHQVVPADLAAIIAAAIPDPEDQEQAASTSLSATPPRWPWAGNAFQTRLAEAKAVLESRL
jgi:hypothetical protein